MQVFIDLHPDFDVAIDRLATWPDRQDEDLDDELAGGHDDMNA